MKPSTRTLLLAAPLSLALGPVGLGTAHAHGTHAGGVQAAAAPAVQAPYDILHAKVTTKGHVAVFHMHTSGPAGSVKPAVIGKLAGSTVHSYVWPTSLDPSAVGFEAKSGILAFAVTAHPDFDDTPLFPAPLGAWHSHWVVLQADDACGKGALKVVDIPEGAKPKLPKTWPGLPILIDSPGWVPRFDGQSVEVHVPFDDIGAVNAASFDAVTAALRVNASVHSPLLCVADVFKVASGDLSLPGKVNR
ncbi:MAG TPA: hypothetical protein VFY73_05860 [Ideonella sp.]|uniref:hypothetical protein n=1 Tax=Ideonella sp. TaxID=1929293 RepID=UPI002E33768A|nr:hypothetical protein [Ideonella sp.]HEX5683546.1 hypothetical protein [Ideonella sp.]